MYLAINKEGTNDEKTPKKTLGQGLIAQNAQNMKLYVKMLPQGNVMLSINLLGSVTNFIPMCPSFTTLQDKWKCHVLMFV